MVMSGLRRLVCVAIVFAMSGSPAVISACMALCLPQMAGPASHEHGAMTPRSQHAPVPAAAPSHAHHIPTAPHESALTSSAPLHGSDARWMAGCADCCPEEQAALVAGFGADRSSAQTLLSAALYLREIPFAAAPANAGVSPPDPLVDPPSPVRAPLVLRI
jgi:hypothetical protein